jgi:hypothetical protein
MTVKKKTRLFFPSPLFSRTECTPLGRIKGRCLASGVSVVFSPQGFCQLNFLLVLRNYHISNRDVRLNSLSPQRYCESLEDETGNIDMSLRLFQLFGMWLISEIISKLRKTPVFPPNTAFQIG